LASNIPIRAQAVNAALERAVAVMSDFRAPWGLAGGWALDLFIGRESRVHADIDVAILRSDQQLLRSRASGRIEKVVSRTLLPWPATEMLEPPVHEIHVTWPDGYQLEFLLNEHDPAAQDWLFRRDARIRRPLALAFVTDRAAPFLAPEIVLLYKAKSPSWKDDADFHSVLPRLEREQRAWLARALHVTAPGHPWATILAREA
jgi:hypothetical protein